MDWHGRVYGTMECTWQGNKRIITGHYRQSDVEGGLGAEKGYSGDLVTTAEKRGKGKDTWFR